MKKFIIPTLLIILSLVAVFSFGKYSNYKKLTFDTVLNKEYIYLNNDVKTNITLAFAQDGIFGFAGVNRYFAGYKLENENSITFSPIGSTMMAGSEEAMQLERQYFDLLKDANKIKIFKNKIILMTSDNRKMKFIEAKKEISTNNSEILGPKINN